LHSINVNISLSGSVFHAGIHDMFRQQAFDCGYAFDGEPSLHRLGASHSVALNETAPITIAAPQGNLQKAQALHEPAPFVRIQSVHSLGVNEPVNANANSGEPDVQKEIRVQARSESRLFT